MTTQNPFLSRKLLLTLLALVFGGVALFMGKVSGQDFFTFVSVLLGMYQTANVVQEATTPLQSTTYVTSTPTS